MMEFQIWKFSCISRRGTLFILSGSYIIGIICCCVCANLVFCWCHWVARSYNHSLMLSFASYCWTCPLTNWVCILTICTTVRGVDWLVSPVSGVQSALRYFLRLLVSSSWAVCQMRGNWLYCRIKFFVYAALMGICHHKIVCFNYCWMHYRTKLLVLRLSWEAAVISGVLGAIRIWLCWIGVSFVWRYVDSTPCVTYVLAIDGLIYLLWACWSVIISFIITHLCRSHSRSSSTNSMLMLSMTANHCVFGILRWSMRPASISTLNKLMSVLVTTMRNCHIHTSLDVLFGLLRQLRLISHMMASSWSKASCHIHQLSLMVGSLSVISSWIMMIWRVFNLWRHLSSSIWYRCTPRCRPMSAWAISISCIVMGFIMLGPMRNCLKLWSVLNNGHFNWRCDYSVMYLTVWILMCVWDGTTLSASCGWICIAHWRHRPSLWLWVHCSHLNVLNFWSIRVLILWNLRRQFQYIIIFLFISIILVFWPQLIYLCL